MSRLNGAPSAYSRVPNFFHSFWAPKFILWRLPPENWKRPPGRPRITWLNTVQRDLRAYNLTLNEAVDLAQNRPLWRLMSTYGATHSYWCMPEKKKKKKLWLGLGHLLFADSAGGDTRSGECSLVFSGDCWTSLCCVATQRRPEELRTITDRRRAKSQMWWRKFTEDKVRTTYGGP